MPKPIVQLVVGDKHVDDVYGGAMSYTVTAITDQDDGSRLVSVVYDSGDKATLLFPAGAIFGDVERSEVLSEARVT